MLSWSATETEQSLDLTAIVTPGSEPGIPGGRRLIDLGHASTGTASDGTTVTALAAELGAEPALKAACVAGAFEIYNRVVDATGLPIGSKARQGLAPIIDALGLDAFPHAAH